MKNIIRPIILLTALSVIFAACEKTDTTPTPVNGGGESVIKKERTIIYTVGNNENRQNLETEAEWDRLLDQLCDQTLTGNEVTFYNISQATHTQDKAVDGAKEGRNISTNDREEIKAWMKDMEKQGLTVRVTYDDGTGTWHGEAYSTLPSESTSYTIIGTWHFKCMVVSQLDTDGNITGSDLFEPDVDGGSMSYTFYADGTMSRTVSGMGGATATNSGTWSLSEDGVLSSELMPNGVDWNVNWITTSTMILSRNDLGDENDDNYYQLQFDAVSDTE